MKIQEFKYKNEDIICTDKMYYFCVKQKDVEGKDIEYIKTDLLKIPNIILDFRGKIYNPPNFNDTYNVVVGHSDYCIDDITYLKYNFKNWFCVNKNTRRDNVYSIPLGITNNCDDSVIHKIYGNTDVFFQILQKEKENKNLVYMSFSINTNQRERLPVYNLFSNKSFVTIGNIETSLEGRKKFLTDIYNHKFVLCPVGNGLDTHRLWETLYMKSIPIVIRDIYNEEHLDLPILMIDKWEEITEEFLNKKYEEFMNREWNMEKLKIGYWFEFIYKKIKF
jgi:hypothetical protein